MFQALLTTSSELGESHTFSGTYAVSAADVESFLGLSAGTLGSMAFEGSALKQTFTVSAGDVLTFEYKFLTTETVNTGATNLDFAFVTLSGYSVLADTNATDFSASVVKLDPENYNPAAGPPSRETNWRTFTYSFHADGEYTLGLGVVDVPDEFFASALLIDNGTLTAGGPPPANAVPEPTSLTLAAIGLSGLALGRRFRRARSDSHVLGA